MSRTPLTLLQGFVLAAKAGKLAHAAEQLNVTVSALSHQIRQLEIRVGRTLFERGPRGVKLTPEGQRLPDLEPDPFGGLQLDGAAPAAAGGPSSGDRKSVV